MSFTKDDLIQIEAKGTTLNNVESQIAVFKSGIPHATIVEAAIIGHGIIKLDDQHIETAVAYFEAHKNHLSILKFVPASGAATRMFKFLFQFIKEYNPNNESLNAYINKNNFKDLSLFLVGLKQFPFYKQVLLQLDENGIEYQSLSSGRRLLQFTKVMLNEDQFNFGNSPKGLIPFHEYKNNVVSSAFEEHLFETALYTSNNTKAKLHFTISERFKDKFAEEFKRIEKKVATKTGIKFEIDFSYQHEATDTIAVDLKNKPFRHKDKSLLFRPSGHGALLANLNGLDADVIFMKNIDNVVVYKYKQEVAKFKKVLAGILLERQKLVFKFLNDFDEKKIVQEDIINVSEFLKHKLNVKISKEFEKYSEHNKIQYLKEQLNRPLRVCGMVKNEGEPGGGPFWVKHKDGGISLQIVESAQINTKDKDQKKILKNATHFNPVDIVCGIKNYKGEKFNLEHFVDHSAAFISLKTKEGKDLKALELPGLWNGSMAFWNTVFVEVPIITFNPVKTVNDLLKYQHQIK